MDDARDDVLSKRSHKQITLQNSNFSHLILLIFRYHFGCDWASRDPDLKVVLVFFIIITYLPIYQLYKDPFISNNYFHDSCLTEICLLDKMNQANLYVLTWLLNHLKPSKLSMFEVRNEKSEAETTTQTPFTIFEMLKFLIF